jgi:hypothetical protein
MDFGEQMFTKASLAISAPLVAKKYGCLSCRYFINRLALLLSQSAPSAAGAAITAPVVSFPRHYHRELGALTGGVATVDPLKILKQHSAQSLIYLNIFYFSCTSSKSRQRGRIQKPVDLGI